MATIVAQNVKPQFDNVKWNITNKSTQRAGVVFAALAVISLVGVACCFGGHGIVMGVGSDAMIFGGVATAIAGIVFAGLKIRDWREKKRAEEAWEGKQDHENELQGMTKGIVITKISLGDSKKETYFLEAEAGGDHVKIYKNR